MRTVYGVANLAWVLGLAKKLTSHREYSGLPSLFRRQLKYFLVGVE